MSQYTPVNLAYVSYDPVGGADETLSPIIFIHGATVSKESWLDVPEIIANKTKRKVYSVDCRNHGDTEWTDEFSFDIIADDLLHFIDTISAPKAVLIGHSMGGITSIRAALKSPERIEMLFVEDMYVKKFSQEVLDFLLAFTSLLEEAIQLIPVDCPEENITGKIIKFINEKMPIMPENLANIEVTEKIVFPVKRDADGRYMSKSNLDVLNKAFKNGDTIMSEPKGLYDGPSYFIYGTVSQFKVNEDEENILKFFPNAELIPVEKADHTIHFQFPETFIDIVVNNILKNKFHV